MIVTELDIKSIARGLPLRSMRAHASREIDRASILAKIRHGVGILQETPFAPGHPLHIDVPRVPYDPAAANAMLDQDGWKRGPDGCAPKARIDSSSNFATGTGLPDTDAMIELIRLNWPSWASGFRRPPLSLAGLYFALLSNGGAASSTTASSTSRPSPGSPRPTAIS